MPADRFEIEILPDGTIKMSTGAVSAAGHFSAEAFLKGVNLAAGGIPADRRRRLSGLNVNLSGALADHCADGHIHLDGSTH
jgi:hypothetical protein